MHTNDKGRFYVELCFGTRCLCSSFYDLEIDGYLYLDVELRNCASVLPMQTTHEVHECVCRNVQVQEQEMKSPIQVSPRKVPKRILEQQIP